MTVRGSGERLIAGLMVGNSLDGISAALAATDGTGLSRTVDLRAWLVHPLADELRARLTELQVTQRFSAADLLAAHMELGEQLAGAVAALAEEAATGPEQLAVIGVQGANVIHAVERAGGFAVSGHLEVGELATVAERTGALVVGDLRPSDIASGGQGAPLSPYVDYLLFADAESARAIQNLGGIANVTFLSGGCQLDDAVAFDCGPGNMVIDRLVTRFTAGAERFDAGGARAARGTVSDPLLAELLSDPYLELPPPKSAGPEEFGDAFADWLIDTGRRLRLADDDLIATATQFTVECIAQSYERFLAHLPDELILTGGGAHNDEIVRRLRRRLPTCTLRLHDEFGIPVDAREALTWAVLADESLHGIATSLPRATGAARRAVVGKIVIPSSLAGRFRAGLHAAEEG